MEGSGRRVEQGVLGFGRRYPPSTTHIMPHVTVSNQATNQPTNQPTQACYPSANVSRIVAVTPKVGGAGGGGGGAQPSKDGVECSVVGITFSSSSHGARCYTHAAYDAK